MVPLFCHYESLFQEGTFDPKVLGYTGPLIAGPADLSFSLFLSMSNLLPVRLIADLFVLLQCWEDRTILIVFIHYLVCLFILKVLRI